MRNYINLGVNFIATTLFVLLFTFSAFGGVLIGQLPEKGGADIRDIKWTIEGDNVQIVFVAADADGKLIEHSLKPVHIDIVRQALRYAADGRPLTVTIIKANPLPDLKILLHPALVDSHLGRSAIQLDQLVDKFAHTNKDRPDEFFLRDRVEMNILVYSQDELYKLVWASRLKPILEFRLKTFRDMDDDEVRAHHIREIQIFYKVFQRYLASVHDFQPGSPVEGADRYQGSDIEVRFTSLISLVDRYLTNDKVRRKAEFAIRQIESLQDEKSFLRTKREYYDVELVEFLCAFDASAELSTILDRAYNLGVKKVDQVKRLKLDAAKLRQGAGWFGFMLQIYQAKHIERTRIKLLKQALSIPPKFTVWSGVRERSFAGELSDYLAPKRPEHLFRFMVQVAFTTPPMFLEGESAEDYSDKTPYEYTEIEDKVNRFVADGIKRDQDAVQAVEEMAAFTQLQRFFRAAIVGKVGKQFPEERLTDLASAIGGGDAEREYVRTLRWLPRPGIVELYGMFKIALVAGVSSEDVVSLRESNLEVDEIRSRFRELTEARLTRMKNSDDKDERNAGSAMLQCFRLLDETLSARQEFLKEATTSDSDREGAWDVFLAEQESWLKRWSEAAKLLDVDASSSQLSRKAAHTLAQINYSVQVRIRMRVMDDERHSDILHRNSNDSSR